MKLSNKRTSDEYVNMKNMFCVYLFIFTFAFALVVYIYTFTCTFTFMVD